MFSFCFKNIYINLQVYDGFDEYSPLFGTYCGDMRVNESCIPPKIRSSSNGLHIQFHSDDRTTAGGVRAVFVSAEGKYKLKDVTAHYVNMSVRIL